MFKPILPGDPPRKGRGKANSENRSGRQSGSGGQRFADRSGPGMVAKHAGKLLDPLLRKRGFVETGVIANWPMIAGPDIASWCQPESLKFPPGRRMGATLELRVLSGRGPEIQQMQALIIERVNRAFGYEAVSRVAIRQGRLPQKPDSRIPGSRPLTEAESNAIERTVAGVENDGLRQALENLGKAVNSKVSDDL